VIAHPFAAILVPLAWTQSRPPRARTDPDPRCLPARVPRPRPAHPAGRNARACLPRRQGRTRPHLEPSRRAIRSRPARRALRKTRRSPAYDHCSIAPTSAAPDHAATADIPRAHWPQPHPPHPIKFRTVSWSVLRFGWQSPNASGWIRYRTPSATAGMRLAARRSTFRRGPRMCLPTLDPRAERRVGACEPGAGLITESDT
jgi:hypothetical protein